MRGDPSQLQLVQTYIMESDRSDYVLFLVMNLNEIDWTLIWDPFATMQFVSRVLERVK
jgi:ATP-dependent Clp protease adapter protein ClpS